MIAILEAKRAGLLRAANWPRNLAAGLIVGVVALPLAMAFAIASGVKPEQGLYTAIIAGIAVSLFGGSRVQIAGPTGAFIVILAGVVAQFGVGGLLVATLMAGVILVAMGLARLGGVIRFIPDPVIVGFTAGIAVIIWVGQWPYFFGLPPPGEGPFYLKAWRLLGSFAQLHWPSVR
jgi:SulP family sulfate permease